VDIIQSPFSAGGPPLCLSSPRRLVGEASPCNEMLVGLGTSSVGGVYGFPSIKGYAMKRLVHDARCERRILEGVV